MNDKISSDFFLGSQNLDYSAATIKKIEGFRELKEGWNFGEGEPFNDNIIDQAKFINKEIIEYGFLETDAFPGSSGEIMVTLYYDDKYLEFTVEPDCTITFAKEKDKEIIEYKEGFTTDKALEKVKIFREEICLSSESFILPSLTIEKTDLKVLPLNPAEKIAGFLFSKQSVLENLVAQSANILEFSMKRSQVSPEFFGSSKNRFFQTSTV